MKCEDCKKRESNIDFCNSTLEWSHGMVQHICRQCYIKRLEINVAQCLIQIEDQKKLLKAEKEK